MNKIGCRHEEVIVHVKGFTCSVCRRYFDDTTFTYKKLILGKGIALPKVDSKIDNTIERDLYENVGE